MTEAESVALAAAQVEYSTALEKQRPSLLLKVKMSIDGNEWCCLFGEDLQNGVAGFGKSPDKAMRDFDTQMAKELK